MRKLPIILMKKILTKNSLKLEIQPNCWFESNSDPDHMFNKKLCLSLSKCVNKLLVVGSLRVLLKNILQKNPVRFKCFV